MLSFAKRTGKEILRDPLNVSFGIGFPLIMLFLLTAIQSNIPVNLFELSSLTPGICVFGLSFITLFSATLISKDRKTALLQRLYTTPLTPVDYILGYCLPMIPISLAQTAICYLAAVCLGMEITVNILYAVLFSLPIALLFIAIGLLCGSIFNDKQVGGVCGALLTNLCAWLSGTWFDLELIGGAFKKFAYALPFVHSVELERAVLNGDYASIFPHIYWVLGYFAAISVLAVLVFTHKMKNN